MRNNGSAKIVVILLALAVVLGVGYVTWQKKAGVPTFPTQSEPQGIGGQEAPVVVEDETGNWEMYRNEKYGFEIKYPTGWRARENIYQQSGDTQFPGGLFEVSFGHSVTPEDYRVLMVRVRGKQYPNLDAYIKGVETELVAQYWDGMGQVKPLVENRISFAGRDAVQREEFVSIPIYSVRFLDGSRAFELVLKGGSSDFSDSDRDLYKLFESSFHFLGS